MTGRTPLECGGCDAALAPGGGWGTGTKGLSPLRMHLVLIKPIDSVCFESIDGPDLCRRGGSFEPRGGTPGILVRCCDQPVIHRVVMNVMESCEIRLLIRQQRLSKVVPDLAPCRPVKAVYPLGCLLMQVSQHMRKAGSSLCAIRRSGDEMAVVREHHPCFELPSEITGQFQQAAMQNRQPFTAAEVVLLEIRACSAEIGTRCRKLMEGCVGPGRLVLAGIRWLSLSSVVHDGGSIKKAATPRDSQSGVTAAALHSFASDVASPTPACPPGTACPPGCRRCGCRRPRAR